MRYADDIRVFVRGKRAAQRVLDSVTDVVERRLKLKVNREKSAVRHAREATVLGFGFCFSRSGVRIRVDPKSINLLKARIRELTSRQGSVSMSCRMDRLNAFTTGWVAYFGLADLGSRLLGLDEWLRLRMRQIRWKEWKRYAARRRRVTRPSYSILSGAAAVTDRHSRRMSIAALANQSMVSRETTDGRGG